MKRGIRRAFWIAAFTAVGSLGLRSAQAQLVITVDEEDLYVKYIDVNTLAVTDLFRPMDAIASPPGAGTDGPEGIAADENNRVFYWQDDNNLYRVFYDALDGGGFMTGEFIADITCAGGPGCNGTANSSMDGLTFANGILYGVRNVDSATAGREGIYTINVNTGAATCIRAWADDGVTTAAQVDIRDIAYNPADGLFYVYNNTSTGFGGTGGAGVYSVDIDNVLMGGAFAVALVASTPDVVTLCGCTAYPPATSTCCGSVTTPDIDGMAIGNGKIYLTIDQQGPILIYDIATDTFDPNIANPWTLTDFGAGGTWAPTALIPLPTTNLGITLDSVTTNTSRPVRQDGVVGIGEQAIYTITINNAGPENATSMEYEITLSGTATYTIASAVGQNSTPNVLGNVISGSITPFTNGATEQLVITIDAQGAGTLAIDGTVEAIGNPPDIVQGNNATSHLAEVKTLPDVDAVVFTEPTASSVIPGHPTLGGAYTVRPHASGSITIYPPYRSPNGDYIAFVVLTDNPDATNDVLVLGDHGTFSVIAQQGVTTTADLNQTFGEMILHSRAIPNNDGSLGINVPVSGPGTNPRAIVKWDGAQFTTLARSNTPIPAFGALNYLYGESSVCWDAVNFDGNGRFGALLDLIDEAPSAEQEMLVSRSGTALLAQSNVTSPIGTAETWLSTTSPAVTFLEDTYWTDGVSLEWIVSGEINGDNAVDKVVAVNNEIVLQEDDVIPGVADPISSFEYAQMNSNGTWYAYGSNDGGEEDWLVRGNGTSFTVLAKAGDAPNPGAPDLWDDAESAQLYSFVAANNQGDYIICGRTDRANTRKNTVCVLNGTTDILREGDPIDVDGNGVFDEDRFVQSFDEHTAVLTDAGEFYCVVNMTDSSSSGASGAVVGRALIRIPVNESPVGTGAELSVAKTGSTNKLTALGQQMTYSIEVCNRGPETATNVVVSDTLPAEFEFVSGTNGIAEVPPGSGILSATIASIPAFKCVTVEVTVQAVAEGAAVVNTASASTNDQADPNPANNTGSAAAVLIQQEADLAVTKVDDGDALVGQNVTYTITITNNGPAPATNVVMTDTLDASTSFVSATNGAAETAPGSGIVTANFASIPDGGSEIVTITVVGNSEALALNNVSVNATEVDINPDNNAASAETLIGNFADVSVMILDSGLTSLGDDITYTITVANNGPQVASNVDVAITLPPELSFVSATNGAVENPGGSGNVEASFATIPDGQSEVITLVAATSTEGTFITTVIATTTSTDPDDINNTAQASTRVGNFRDIVLILSELATHPTSTAVGAKDATGQPVAAQFQTISNLAISPDGTHWLARADTNQPTSENQVLVLGMGDNGAVAFQEAQPAPGGAVGEVFASIFDSDTPGGFNDINDFAFSARVNLVPSGDDERVYRVVGGIATQIITEDDPVLGVDDVNADGDETLGNSVSGVHLLNDNRAGYFVTPIGNCHSSRYPGLFYDNQVHRHNGMPIGVSGANWGTINLASFYTTPDGMHWLARGRRDDGISGPVVLVVDDAIAVQGGDVFGSVTVGTLTQADLGADGTWAVRASINTTASSPDVAIRNDVTVAETGQPIVGGTENWGDSISGIDVNDVGDYVVVGNTDVGDTALDTVVVLNGTEIVMREGDPIDLDDNGQFDDGVYINGFFGAYTFITNDKVVWARVTLRDEENLAAGDAIIRVSVAEQVVCATIQGDAGGDGSRNGIDVADFVDCILTGGVPAGSCNCVDYDNDDDVDFADLNAFATQLVTDPA